MYCTCKIVRIYKYLQYVIHPSIFLFDGNVSVLYVNPPWSCNGTVTVTAQTSTIFSVCGCSDSFVTMRVVDKPLSPNAIAAYTLHRVVRASFQGLLVPVLLLSFYMFVQTFIYKSADFRTIVNSWQFPMLLAIFVDAVLQE